jgi:beta-lactamase regulating signal transducer with metallopeptidase domain
MPAWIGCDPGDRALDVWLVVALGVTVTSGAAWLISRRLAGRAALRHLVLSSALVCCLAVPAAACFCAATGLTLISLPLLCGAQARVFSGTEPTETTLAWTGCAPPQPTAGPLSSSEVRPAGRLATPRASLRKVVTGALFVWAAGAVSLLIRLARDCGRVVRLRRAARPVRDERLRTLSREVAGRLGMRRIPLLLVSGRAATPLAVGFGRPAVLLPERLIEVVGDDELRDILAHELAHLRRGDQRTVLLQGLAAALYWPVVPVHGLNRELRQAREEVCDNVVLAGRDALGYGETLLHVAELLVSARPTAVAVGLGDGPGELEGRIRRLIDPARDRATTIGRATACAVAFLFAAGVGSVSATRLAAPAAAASPVERGSAADAVRSPGHDGDLFVTYCCPS